MPVYSATEIAFLMVACQQAVLAFGWLAGATLMAESRRAALNWAAYAALNALSLMLFVVSVKPAIEAGRAVEWRFALDLPTLQADPALLQDLLVQLLGNALKFTRQAAQPCIAVQAVVAPAGHVAFTVQDNGVGFDPARAGTLFGVFQRLHRESEFEGVGTGLALCRAIAQRHGGAITATAVPGAGCTVRVEWPAHAA